MRLKVASPRRPKNKEVSVRIRSVEQPRQGYLGVSSLGVGSVQTLETARGEGSWHVEQLIVSQKIPQKMRQLN